MTIRLPLTLAIIEGLQVIVGSDRYILPLSMVEECIELNEGTRAFAGRRDLVHIRGEIIPYIRLREWFHTEDGNGHRLEREQIVVTNDGNIRIGFVVDSVIGEHQTVIKPLGKIYRNAKGISGATILGDGTVALIIDIQQLAGNAERAAKSTLRGINEGHKHPGHLHTAASSKEDG